MLQIASVGEIFLDLLPNGVRLGGTPVGTAWYCAEMGAQAWLVSAVGDDQHGWRVQRELKERHLSERYVPLSEKYATGEARVHYDANGKSSYHFLEDVAWDHIAQTPELLALASQTNAVIYSTLGQRSEQSRQTIYAFLDKQPAHSLRLLNLHLRVPYYNAEVLEQSFRRATVVKINQYEMQAVADFLGQSFSCAEEMARALLSRYADLRFVAYTRGENGSLLFDRIHTYECGGFYADQFINPLGCGEAFCAVLCLGLLNGADPAKINEEANRAACCVCSEPDMLATFSDEVLDSLQKAHII